MREYKAPTKELIVTTTISTPIGEMFAAATKNSLIMLSFFSQFNIEAKIMNLKNHFDADIIPSNSPIFDKLKIELEEYFNHQRKEFTIPLQLIGSSFQIECWKEILKVPFGETISYKQLAQNIQNPKANRAVANASSQNMLNILVPCHRVISSNTEINGYNGGIEKKEFLIDMERNGN